MPIHLHAAPRRPPSRLYKSESVYLESERRFEEGVTAVLSLLSGLFCVVAATVHFDPLIITQNYADTLYYKWLTPVWLPGVLFLTCAVSLCEAIAPRSHSKLTETRADRLSTFISGSRYSAPAVTVVGRESAPPCLFASPSLAPAHVINFLSLSPSLSLPSGVSPPQSIASRFNTKSDGAVKVQGEGRLSALFGCFGVFTAIKQWMMSVHKLYVTTFGDRSDFGVCESSWQGLLL